MNPLLLSAEHELRANGALSEATCRAFTAADDETRRGFEASFAFLGCPANTAAPGEAGIPAARRITAIRLMMLRLRAQTSEPRWSSHALDTLIEAALRPPGALVGDVVHALFVLLGEASQLSETQVNFIRAVGVHVVGIQRHRYSAEDFLWLADMLRDAGHDLTAAQAYLAAYTLPPFLISDCLEVILNALRSTRFAEDVKRDVGE